MGPVIWLETLTRGREVQRRERLERSTIRVGRAFDNDVVIDDPHVAAHHLHIEHDGTAWIARDLGSVNGLWTQAPARRVDRAVLDGAHPVRIGNTLLRVRDARHAVPAERPLRSAHAHWLAPLLAALLALLTAGPSWLSTVGEPQPEAWLGGALAVLLVTTGWAALWALANRLFARQTRFMAHASLAFGMACAMIGIELLASVLAYALSAPGLLRPLRWLPWLLAAVDLLGHLLIVSPRRVGLKTACVVVLIACGAGLQAFTLYQNREDRGPHAVLEQLFPPSLRIVEPEALDAFSAGLPALQPELDEARRAALDDAEQADDASLDLPTPMDPLPEPDAPPPPPGPPGGAD